MSRHQSVLAVTASRVAIVLLAAFGLGSCAANPPEGSGTQECQCKGKKHQVNVSVVGGMPETKPGTVTAREGDLMHWVFRGPEAREFAIMFKSVQDSPFDWSEQKGAQVKACVKAGAARDGKATDYKYSVGIDGKVEDPKIIIEP